MAKKILILGNGFDLAHGLPTTYRDFMDFCTMVEKNFKFSLVHDMKKKNKKLEGKFNDWKFHSKIKNRLLGILKTMHIDYENDTREKTCIKELHDCINGNVWYRYFEKLLKTSSIKGSNWIDFESEISKVIEYLDRETDRLDAVYVELKHTDDEKIETFRFELEESFRIKNKIEWDEFDYETTIMKVREKCFEDLEELTRALEIYLAYFIEKIEVTPIEIISEIKPDRVINFNYTSTYERCYINKDDKVEVFHIHGNCVEERSIEENNMVLGIDEYWDDANKDTNTNFVIFKKFVQRIRKRNGMNNYYYLRDIKANYRKTRDEIERRNISNTAKERELHDNLSNVYVFGHSLDKTDKDILKDFFESEATAITIYCKDRGTEGELIANMIQLVGQRCLMEKINAPIPTMRFVVPD